MTAHNVCSVLLDVLADAGVEYIFGIPGDAINDLIEAIRKQDRIRFIQVRHEEAGAFAASAHAKLTGRLGVCTGTAGPGAVHLLNGLYDAKMDHAPVLAITGQVDTAHVGTDYHQEVDLLALFRDVTVFNQRIINVDQMPRLVVQACRSALDHRGVAHIGIPHDVASRTVAHPERHAPVQPSCNAPVPGDDDLDRAADVLNRAGKVAILAGIGCKGGRDALFEVADILGAPIARTLRAKDIVPDDHPFSVGGLGMLGTTPAVDVMANCDALLMAGTDFPYETFFPNATPAVQIDIEPTRIGRRYPVAVGLSGDAPQTLKALAGRLRRKEDRGFIDHARAAMSDWNADMEKQGTSTDTPIRPQVLARAVGMAARDDAVFIADTGTVTAWAARHLPVRHGQHFTLSSALASMAFGLPGAIGAQLTYPDRQVVALVGDGGFSMLMADFLTAVRYHLPVKVVVFNNHKLGLIRMEQEAAGFPESQTDLLNPDFAAYARLCGGEGFRVTDPADLVGTLREAFAATGPCVVDVETDPDALVMPPKIGVKQAFGFSLAKMREFIDRAGSLR